MTAALAPTDRDTLHDAYRRVRDYTESLSAPLSPEDQVVQSMPDASPTKWHRAHTTWFFETFLLSPRLPRYTPFDASYAYLFNSYYEAVGPRHPRAERGLVTRPSVGDIARYRAYVDDKMHDLIDCCDADAAGLIELGLHHEQQHQELLLMDIKHVLSCNPTDPVYTSAPWTPRVAAARRYLDVRGGNVVIGHDVEGFAFDNESPSHVVYLEPFRIADGLVTAAEWLEFIADDGYHRPDLWLSDGWYAVQQHQWESPDYWRNDGDDGWTIFTLEGRRALDPNEPVVHVSHYEADAYARWHDARLPTEFEWEHAARSLPPGALRDLSDVAWQWTASAYLPYPRFHPAAGAVGEYNGKFMSSQMTLRGGAYVTPAGHTPCDVPKLLPAREPMGVRRVASRQGRVLMGSLEEDARRGLTAVPKDIPPKWFYDDRGSELFDEITRLPEYYPTRSERAILDARAGEIVARAGSDTLVELGSGTSEKTRLLLDAMRDAGQLQRFVPFDVSKQTLHDAAAAIEAEYPGVDVQPVVGDFTADLDTIPHTGRRLVAFLGGTIGNLLPDVRTHFLADIASMMGPDDHFLLGTDLVKDVARLEAAYDDAAGVTAEFNKNVLTVMNRQLDAAFDPDTFEHVAVWDRDHEWIEMRLRSTRDQTVPVRALDMEVTFTAGEEMRTEVSAKFRREGIAAELSAAGMELEEWWTDPNGDFALSLSRLS